MDDDPNDLTVLLHGSKVFLELLFAVGIAPPLAGLCESFFLALVPESYTEGARRDQPGSSLDLSCRCLPATHKAYVLE